MKKIWRRQLEISIGEGKELIRRRISNGDINVSCLPDQDLGRLLVVLGIIFAVEVCF